YMEVKRSSSFFIFNLFSYHRPMKSTVFNKNLIIIIPSSDDTSYIYSRYISFHSCCFIKVRLSIIDIYVYTDGFKKGKIRLITGHRKYKVVMNYFLVTFYGIMDFIFCEFSDLRIKLHMDIALSDK